MNAHPKAKKKIKKRPLLQNIDQARALYDERLPLYRKAADLEVNVEKVGAEDIADRIIAELKLS